MNEVDAESSQADEPRSDGRQMTRSAGVVGLFILLSRVFGLVRDGVAAAMFEKRETDAFFVAFTIPNVVRRLLAEGSLTVAFIPVYTEYRARHGEQAARRLLASTLGASALATVAVCALGMVFAPSVVKMFAYGLSREPEKMALAVLLARITFPFLLMAGLTALAMGVLNTHQHFAAPAFAPALLNVCIIVTVLTLSSAVGRLGMPRIAALAIGVLVGGTAQVLVQLPALRARGLLVRPRLELDHPGVRRVARLMLPSLFGLAIYQVNVILSRQFASFLADGAISYLYYAQRLIEFPLGIFAAALATVSMPDLARHASTGDMAQVKATYRYALRLLLFVLLPATGGLIALALPVVSVLFQRGEFTAAMARETAWTLGGFAIGLAAAGGVRQTVPTFYALQDTRTPVFVSGLGLLVYVGCALAWYRRFGTVGLALAVAVSSTVSFALLLGLLRRRIGRLGLSELAAAAVRGVIGGAACAAAAWGVSRWGSWDQGAARPSNVAVLLAAVLAGATVYAAVAWLLRAPELRELGRAFRRRRGGRRSVRVEPSGEQGESAGEQPRSEQEDDDRS